MSRRYEDVALLMAALHPGKKPQAVQQRLAKTATKMLREAAVSQRGRPFWQDVEKFKRMLRGMGIPVGARKKRTP
jgi:hypothetical protein